MLTETPRPQRTRRGDDLVLLSGKDRSAPLHSLSEIIFLGTGSSSGTPMVSCVMKGQEGCEVCKECMKNPHSQNVRNNPSLLIRYRQASDISSQSAAREDLEPEDQNCTATIVIDVGKTFKRSALNWFSKYKVANHSSIPSRACSANPHCPARPGAFGGVMFTLCR